MRHAASLASGDEAPMKGESALRVAGQLTVRRSYWSAPLIENVFSTRIVPVVPEALYP